MVKLTDARNPTNIQQIVERENQVTGKIELAATEDCGVLGVYHLKRLWSAVVAERAGMTIDRVAEWQTDRVLLDALGLGLHQTMQYLFQLVPSFQEFEEWVAATAGIPDAVLVARINAEIADLPLPQAVCQWIDKIENSAPVLTDEDLTFWQQNGYVVLANAVNVAGYEAAEKAIWQRLGATRSDRESWYKDTDSAYHHGIMLEFIQHPALQANRQSSRIHKAFSQLWRTANLWVSTDRCSFHAPQREGQPFPGPDLHWDQSLWLHKPATWLSGISHCHMGAGQTSDHYPELRSISMCSRAHGSSCDLAIITIHFFSPFPGPADGWNQSL